MDLDAENTRNYVMENTLSNFQGALIGCGFVSQYHLEGWSRVTDANIVALCDIDQGRLIKAKEQCPWARPYTNAAKMFAMENRLDFVEICTRPDTHCELVRTAADHGCHVLCQKPIALTRWDLTRMIDVCKSSNVRLMVHENWRFRPWYRAMRAELDAGTIGRPIRLRIAHRDTRSLQPDGFRDQPYFRTMPRLILIEMGPHLIDTARYLMGEIESVSATLGKFGRNSIGEDSATLSVEFSSGAVALIDMSWCASTDQARPEWALNETIVEGTEGSLRLLLDGSLERTTIDGRRERRAVPLPPDDQVYVDGYAATQRHFIDGLKHDRDHETSGVSTLKTMDVIWAGYISAEQRRTITILSLS